MKLTPRQHDVLTNMREGWELRKFGDAWLRSGVHRIDVNSNLFHSLVRKGLVKDVPYLDNVYTLTPKAAEVL